MNTSTALLLAALLSIYRPPGRVRARIDAHREQIATDATNASAATGVPVGLLLVTGQFESHLGQESDSGGSWGSPVSRFRRHVAGGAWHTARDLAASLRVCGTYERALYRYRSGRCAPHRIRGYQVATVMWTVRRIYERAGLVVPDGFAAATRHR
jgi:hypothetical protein